MSIDPNMERRGFLKCMTWAGTAMVWTVAGGVPRSRLIGSAEAAATTSPSYRSATATWASTSRPIRT